MSWLDAPVPAVVHPRSGWPIPRLGWLTGVALLVGVACARDRPVAGPSPTVVDESSPRDPKVFVPPTHREGGVIVMPATFPDGTTAEILYPPELDLAQTGIQPYTSASGPAGVGRDFTIVYGQAEEVLSSWGEVELLAQYPDGRGGTVSFWRTPDVDYLAFQFGSWSVLVYDYQDPGARMSEEQRSMWATHLRGHEKPGGWLVLEAEPPLTLARAEHAGPQLDFWYPGAVKGVLLFAGECTPLQAGEGFKEEDIEILEGVSVARTKDVHGDWFASWCDPKVPMRVHVYSGRDEALIEAVLGGLEIRVV